MAEGDEKSRLHHAIDRLEEEIGQTREERSRRHREIWEATIGPAFAESNKIFDARKEPPPPYLLHFTNAKALISIIENRTLWLSRARSSNDPKELDHGFALARDEQNKAIENEGDELFRDELFASFEGRLTDATQGHTLDPHICCFTEADNADVVAHWAMYGRDGSGFALKFKGNALEQMADVGLAKVNYNDQQQRAYLRELLALARKTCQQAAEYAQAAARRRLGRAELSNRGPSVRWDHFAARRRDEGPGVFRRA